MIISTSKKKPLSFFFLIFNFIIFWIFEFFLLKNKIDEEDLILVATMTLFVSFITSVTYILIDIYITCKREQKIFDTSTYVRDYGASVFNGYDSLFLFKLKDEVHNISINETNSDVKQISHISYSIKTHLEEIKDKVTENTSESNNKDWIEIYINNQVHNSLNNLSKDKETKSSIGYIKYKTKEEAIEVGRQRARQRYNENKEEMRKHQKEYYQKRRYYALQMQILENSRLNQNVTQ
jgi:hypothetical protein